MQVQDDEEKRRLRRKIVQLEQENTQLRKVCNLPSPIHTKHQCKVRIGKTVFIEPGDYKEVRKRYPYADIEEM